MILAARSLSSQLIACWTRLVMVRLTHAAVSLSPARLPPQPRPWCPQRVAPLRQSRRRMPRAGPEKAAGSFWCPTDAQQLRQLGDVGGDAPGHPPWSAA
jgi:hypothetical protein